MAGIINASGFFAKKILPQLQCYRPEASDVPFAPPQELSARLASFCSNDMEKVRAFFVWIADNISYKIPEKNTRKKNYPENEINEEDTGALKPLDVRVAEQVLKNKTAYCDGYSRLFKTLCDFAGIRCEVISGYARTNYGNQGSFKPNHTWNAVYVDSSWHLLDVTWASGFISIRSGDFVRYYDDHYFLTPPDVFIRDHYPDDIRWTLLDKWPPIREFNRSPYRNQSFIKYSITSFYPSSGIIEAAPGDTIRIILETGSVSEDKKIAPEPEWDDSTLGRSGWAVAHPISGPSGNKIIYSYTVPDNSPEWLHIIYNEDPVLRYRIRFKKGKLPMNTN